MRHPLLLASGYAAFLLLCASLLRRSATRLRHEAGMQGEPLAWPHSDAVALRQVLAGTLGVLAAFIVAVALLR